ncbi:hypothetical protein D3OALGA1CA_3230 [Olavius algarvensis associated proteobacterium Delta 3]|nr:hypothetical protein D3OALGB2SA_1873 [Olavius algarvensis associated proteobacterium Delta 3]CAB5131066.1 hypothetical protein D3OALGA1CA_3230 [Olavius algarvensis associated proteobacterium Delta 3]
MAHESKSFFARFSCLVRMATELCNTISLLEQEIKFIV